MPIEYSGFSSRSDMVRKVVIVAAPPTAYSLVLKFNPYHGKGGLFSSKDGGTSAANPNEASDAHEARIAAITRNRIAGETRRRAHADPSYMGGPGYDLDPRPGHEGPKAIFKEPTYMGGPGYFLADIKPPQHGDNKHSTPPEGMGGPGWQLSEPVGGKATAGGPADKPQTGKFTFSNDEKIANYREMHGKYPPASMMGGPGWQLDQLKTTGQDGGFDSKDAMRIHDILKKSANTDGVPDWNKVKAKSQQMANAITDYDKAHRRANAADFESLPEVGSIFRARADAIAGSKFKAQGISTHQTKADDEAFHHEMRKRMWSTDIDGGGPLPNRADFTGKGVVPPSMFGKFTKFLSLKRDTGSLGFRK